MDVTSSKQDHRKTTPMTFIRPLAGAAALSVALLLSANVQAAETGNWAGNVFAFQQEMAEKGHVQAQYLLGGMYEEGRGTYRDMELAMQWYQKAAARGHDGAIARLRVLSPGS